MSNLYHRATPRETKKKYPYQFLIVVINHGLYLNATTMLNYCDCYHTQSHNLHAIGDFIDI